MKHPTFDDLLNEIAELRSVIFMLAQSRALTLEQRDRVKTVLHIHCWDIDINDQPTERISGDAP